MNERAEASIRRLLEAIEKINHAADSVEQQCSANRDLHHKHDRLKLRVKQAIADIDTVLERKNG